MTDLNRATGTIADPETLVFHEGRYITGAELNELQIIASSRTRRIGNMVAADGDPQEGCELFLDGTTARLTAGLIYVAGDVRRVEARTLTGLVLTGEVNIGVRLIPAVQLPAPTGYDTTQRQTVTTAEDNPALYGQTPGTVSFGEPGADRSKGILTWALETESAAGEFYRVYTLKDGQLLTRRPPPELSGVGAVIRQYDKALGNYIVGDGGRVKALGRIDGAQHFVISQCEFNVLGRKLFLSSDRRHVEPETFDTEFVPSEGQPFNDGGTGTAVLTLNRFPITAISAVQVIVERTQQVTRGNTSGGTDLLDRPSVTGIVSVSQGATVYQPGTQFIRAGDAISWAPGGTEPATGSTYSVVYRHRVTVPITAISATDTTITVTQAGAVTGQDALVSYEWKLPRKDLLCFAETGETAYVKGVSARANPQAPLAPANLLPLAEISNDWLNVPGVRELQFRNVPFAEINRRYQRSDEIDQRLFDALLQVDVSAREPAAKRGIFVDNFINDSQRDQGEAQTATVGDGVLRLSIASTLHRTNMTGVVTLPFVHEPVITQRFKTKCQKINEYMNFTALPGALRLTPSTDFWTVNDTQWLSPETQVFGTGNVSRNTSRDLLVGTRQTRIANLRQTQIAFAISGFAPGEILETLTFDGLNVKPAGVQTANPQGQITGQFTIPANVPAGTKRVIATGQTGTRAVASFAGQGTINTRLMRRLTTVSREREGGDRADPVLQSFTLPTPRQITGIDLSFCHIGNRNNPCVVELRGFENGNITDEQIIQTEVPMTGVVANADTRCLFAVPTYTAVETCFVVKSDDPDHSIWTAVLGGVATVNGRQVRVTEQPYSVGVFGKGSNDSTYNYFQEQDAYFTLLAARYTQTSLTVVLGNFALENASDLLVQAAVDLPEEGARLWFEIVRANGEVIALEANTPRELSDFLTEPVTLRAQLRGTETISPVLFPGVTLVAGRLAASGTYMTKAFDMGSNGEMNTVLDTFLPSGSTILVEVEDSTGTLQPMPQVEARNLDLGWVERKYRRSPHTAPSARQKITITGTPSARPYLAANRAWYK